MHGAVTHCRTMLDSGMAIPVRLISVAETHYTQRQPARRGLANCLPFIACGMLPCIPNAERTQKHDLYCGMP